MFFLFKTLSRLPLVWAHRLGALAGVLVYLASPRYRRNLRENMRAAGLDANLAWPAAAEAGKQALEISHIWMKSQAEANAQIVEITGGEHVAAAKAAGRGVLFLTPHLGCFEIAAQYCAAAFGDLTVLYRPPRQKSLQRMILAGRQRPGLHLATADLSGVRALIKALKKGEAVGMLPDQAPKAGEGAWIEFFGRPAYTMTLAARLSETGATVLMVWGERLPQGRGYRLHYSPPSQAITGDTLTRAQKINQEIERLIRCCPTQYLWGYNRYKGYKGDPEAVAPTASEQ
ncbi:MAG: lysophospholipid acyltransferase family protein [Zoogloeaceae bacterium]|jgi:KDO2-lipid IV(A) lauroyltransferase|nr:lysophospholipid acyltransferase family protein [Zoogloeaceae bacterium]